MTAEGLLDNPYDNVKANIPAIGTRLWNRFKDLIRPAILVKNAPARKELRRTAYLDGIRGFAAFLVYWQHHQAWARYSIDINNVFENGFGYHGKHYLSTFPIIRLMFTGGHFAVAVFYVLSGYVLTAKPLQLIQAGEYEKLGDNVASALFRRWLRLWIPVAICTFVYMSSLHLFGIWVHLDHKEKFRDDLWLWYSVLKNFSFVFDTSGNPYFPLNIQIWSIPIEMKGSIVVYTVVMALSRCTRNARLWLEAGLMFYFMYIADGAYYAMFIGGMFLSDLDLLALSNDLPRWLNRLSDVKELIFYHFLVAAFLLAGVPSNSREIDALKENYGWYYMSYLVPQAVFDYKWFFLFWAAMFFVSATRHISWLKRFFEIPFNQYLGKISFAFYLVHVPILAILGDRMYAATGWVRKEHLDHFGGWINAMPLSKGGIVGLELSFLVPQIILLPLSLWMAEIVTKLVDEPSVRFAQWFYRKTLNPAAVKS